MIPPIIEETEPSCQRCVCSPPSALTSDPHSALITGSDWLSAVRGGRRLTQSGVDPFLTNDPLRSAELCRFSAQKWRKFKTSASVMTQLLMVSLHLQRPLVGVQLWLQKFPKSTKKCQKKQLFFQTFLSFPVDMATVMSSVTTSRVWQRINDSGCWRFRTDHKIKRPLTQWGNQSHQLPAFCWD